ncbi:aspartate dehydrogenase [Siminovitchia acidinfaciens]|uniref:L-aspartate dehydrogenase n=1 Tax=Siminovitchia acidinfaciens TaxID=2321395 RepID=A0A429XWI9_9BACI|nr:aspartate dehydrogenase [Siminovitchia acidinfaciens]RST72752.1 aspartate dehydrogenase [Siminovitchia acidinfaciens]
MNIGLIGAGTMGKFLLEKLNIDQLIPNYRIISVLDEREKAKEIMPSLSGKYDFTFFDKLDSFLNSGIDLIVESSNIETVQKYAYRILCEKDMVVISVGALADPAFFNKLKLVAEENATKLYLPAGAIGGLDAIKAAGIMGDLHSVSLVTRKPGEALSGGEITEERVLFDGSAKEAIARFPENANVAITLSLAGIGVEKTEVKIIADPKVDKNTHTIQAAGDFGKMEFTLQNNPSPDNPKTSHLTALSILSSLRSLQGQVVIG